MRYAIVSDIHANLQAWNAVLIDIRSQDLDQIICLGDLVGYGPNPVEVLESVHANVQHLVLGNHDAVICGKMSSEGFNETASQLISWTADNLGENARRFLGSLPLSLRHGDLRFAHGEFSEPGAFHYIIDPQDAIPSWAAVKERVLFVGHTHRPAIFLLGRSGTPHLVEPQDFEIEAQKRYLVNVGSVGHPRTPDTRASYCILDTDARSVCWRFVPFDLDAYRAASETAGLPDGARAFLCHDPRRDVPPLRALLGFSPPEKPESGMRHAREVVELTGLKRRVTTWRWTACLLATALVLGAACMSAAVLRHRTRSATIHQIIGWTARQPGVNPVPLQWAARLGNRYRQTCSRSHNEDGAPVIVWRSATTRDEMRLSSPEIGVTGEERFCMETLIRRGPDFAGTIAAVASVSCQKNGELMCIDQFVVKEPNLPRKDGWLKAQQTFDMPAGAMRLQIGIRGRFTGSVEIGETHLFRK